MLKEQERGSMLKPICGVGIWPDGTFWSCGDQIEFWPASMKTNGDWSYGLNVHSGVVATELSLVSQHEGKWR